MQSLTSRNLLTSYIRLSYHQSKKVRSFSTTFASLNGLSISSTSTPIVSGPSEINSPIFDAEGTTDNAFTRLRRANLQKLELGPTRIAKEDLPPLEEPLVVQFLGNIMKHGKKSQARSVIVRCLNHIRFLTNREPFTIFRQAIELASPLVTVRRIKTSTMKATNVPKALNERQRVRRAMKSIMKSSEKRKGRDRAVRYAIEMVAIVSGQSEIVTEKKKEHADAAKNRASVPGGRSFGR